VRRKGRSAPGKKRKTPGITNDRKEEKGMTRTAHGREKKKDENSQHHQLRKREMKQKSDAEARPTGRKKET